MTDQGEPVDVVYLDFSPAMRINLKITRWMEEFLKNKTFQVKLGGHLSSEGIIKSGVPQGSVLGPLLFLIL